MFVLSLIALILAILGVVAGLLFFNDYCQNKFGHAFLTKTMFVVTAAGFLLVYYGHMWYQASVNHHGDTLNGIVLMVLGNIMLFGVIYHNVTKTNLLYGVTGSTIQIALFGTIGYVAVTLLIIAAIANLMLMVDAKPVWIVNK